MNPQTLRRMRLTLTLIAAWWPAVTLAWAQNQTPQNPGTQNSASRDQATDQNTAASSEQNANDAETPVPAVTGSVDTQDRMLAPPPVSGEDYPIVVTSEARTNFLRGGVTFDTAYNDNVLAGTGANPASDVSYSIFPTIALDMTTARSKFLLSYAPGFTFYHKLNSRDETDQNLTVGYQYRLSPHVTMSLRDAFQRSSNAFNQPDQGLGGSVSGSIQGNPNFLVAPIADRLTNNGNAGLTYQFSANAMVGVDASFINLHYPNPSQVLGELYDSSAQVVSLFHTLRLNKKHYVGVTYQYQRLLSYPSLGTTETQTNAPLFFYTWLPTARFTASLFAGPQFSSTSAPGQPNSTLATPEAGVSLSWQALHTALAASYTHAIVGGGGLIGASRADTANAFLRQQLSKHLFASVIGGYANNRIILVPNLPDTSGHTISASAAFERQFGTNVNVQAGYTRLRQLYSNVPAISAHPDTNREWLSISYQFTKALGR